MPIYLNFCLSFKFQTENLSLCLSFVLCIYHVIHLSLTLPVCHSLYMFVYLPFCLFILVNCQSVYWHSIHLPVCLNIILYIGNLSVNWFVCLSNCLSIFQSVCLFIYMVRVSIYSSISLTDNNKALSYHYTLCLTTKQT